MIARFSLIFALVFAAAGAALCAAGGLNWLLNAFAAAIGSYFVAIASFASYKNMIAQAAGNYESGDRGDQNGENEGENEENEDKDEDEKIPLKTRSFYAVRSFSPLRLAGYAALVFGFFALNVSDRFAVAPFLIALGVLPFSALIFAAISMRSER